MTPPPSGSYLVAMAMAMTDPDADLIAMALGSHANLTQIRNNGYLAPRCLVFRKNSFMADGHQSEAALAWDAMVKRGWAFYYFPRPNCGVKIIFGVTFLGMLVFALRCGAEEYARLLALEAARKVRRNQSKTKDGAAS
jgi:hypothetical protein